MFQFRSSYRTRVSTSVALLACILTTAPCAVAAFTYPNFASTNGLNLVGDAFQHGPRLRLTRADRHQIGGAWHITKQHVAAGFQTSFAFEVSEPDPNFGADGFAFIVQNVSSTALDQGSGSSLGFMDIGTGAGLENFLAVEFDTHNSGITFDTNGNHIAIQSKSTGQPRIFLGSANPPFTIQGGGIHTAQITYEPGVLRIAVDNSPTPLLQVNVDLGALLGLTDHRAWVGFTAATGAAWENHDILSWTFATTVPEPSCMVLVLTASLMCWSRRRSTI